MLEGADWVVVTNFERGQRRYVRRLIDGISADDVRAGHAVTFRDVNFFTILIRAGRLRARR